MRDPRPLTLRPPRGWSARIGRRQAGPGEASHPMLHAATVPLTASRSDYASDVAARLGVDDALVVLLEFGAASARTALFAAKGLPMPGPDEFGPQNLQRTLTGQSGYQRFFSSDGRPFCLYVVLGAHSRRVRTVGRVHTFLDAVDLRSGAMTLRGAS